MAANTGAGAGASAGAGETEFRSALDQLAEGVSAGADQAPRSGREAKAEEHPSVAALVGALGSDVVLRHEVQAGDEHVVFVEPTRVREVLAWLRDHEGYDLLVDLTAVDFGGGRPIQVVYQLWSIPKRRALRLKAELSLDALEIETVVPLWNSANWMEREVYDLFGVDFAGHPDLRRILMPENYAEGHPLRKDFPLRGRFSRAEQTRRALEMDVEDFYIPEEMAVYAEGGSEAERAARAQRAPRRAFPTRADADEPVEPVDSAADWPMRPEGSPGVPASGSAAEDDAG
ncbi:MAG TPA: NADH-quinone oxidoreductase subunit C [Longimicrobiales bacterium]|nr:NADH-quinone oxidoreductase subunit C [Longimicrobiales bacterium]